MVTDTAAVYRTKYPDYAYDSHQAHQRKQQERRLRCTSPGASPLAPLLHLAIVHDSRSPFRYTSCSCAFNEGDAYSRHLGCHQRTGFCSRCSPARLFGDEEEIRAHLAVHEMGNRRTK
ncbi:hypothetical protein HPB49_003754 [Dermacentor silvarum]|uniref:Uncharacterized protein n=1 Tax=Dermacentor silvarum TaxID=543639 RepID=A0ACB8DU87_DERSI|nr:hypothetical protein HPB49_003754 [Dermacentor silvarum]